MPIRAEHHQEMERDSKATERATTNLPLSHLAQTTDDIPKEINPATAPESIDEPQSTAEIQVAARITREGASARRSNYLTVTIERMESSFLVPIPLTLIRSSTDLKGPTSSR